MENKKIVFVSDPADIEPGDPTIQWCVKTDTGFTFYESTSETVVATGQKVLLAADVVAPNDATYYTVFTIPLPASTFCSVRVVCVAESDEAGVAAQLSFKVSEATTLGTASIITPETSSTNSVDNLELSTTEAESNANGLIDIDLPFIIQAEVGLSTGATPGNLIMAVRPESGTGNVTIRKNSYYILT